MSNRKLKPEEVDITYQGEMITLPDTPEKMKLRAAIEVLEQKEKDEQQVMDVHELIDGHPRDALVAFNKALRQKFGWVSAASQTVESFFGTKEIRPDLISVKTGPKDHQIEQVLSGMFKLPNVEHPINTSPHMGPNGPCLVIYGEARKRDFHIIRDLAILTRKILREESIYKGKSITLNVNKNGKLDMQSEPSFLETDDIDVDDLVLNQSERNQVEACLWAPIANTEACIKHRIPLNRGILLEGVFGTGKTMTAHATSRVCVDNGWTYIMLNDVRGLSEALTFAQRYQPAVVFAEDIDRVIGQRDQAGNDLLNTIDGVLTKNAQVITVLTTNHVEKMEQAMLRPGRLDAIISVKPPEEEAVKKLINLYARDLLNKGEGLDKVAKILAGNIPATIREVVERSKLAMIYRGDDKLIEADLVVSAENMAHHLDLLKAKRPEDSVHDRLGKALDEIMKGSSSAATENMAGQIVELHEHII